MKVMKNEKPMHYFEKVYLGKNEKGNNISTAESKRLQKLLSAKALASSVDSCGVKTADLKRMMRKEIKLSKNEIIDFESIINPFEMA